MNASNKATLIDRIGRAAWAVHESEAEVQASLEADPEYQNLLDQQRAEEQKP